MEKKEYQKPEVEVTEFEKEDVIDASYQINKRSKNYGKERISKTRSRSNRI